MSERFGIQVNYKDGKKDWFDPCTEFPEPINGIYTIDNGCYTYEIEAAHVKDIFKYDLCKDCSYDVRAYDCTEECCYNPQ